MIEIRSGIDVRERFAEAENYLREGRFEEALDAWVWFWQHALEHEPAIGGVRGSYAVEHIHELCQAYAPARSAFFEIRSRVMAGLGESPKRSDVADFVSLSEALDEQDDALEWIRKAPDALLAREDLEYIWWTHVRQWLVARRDWALMRRIFARPRMTLERLRTWHVATVAHGSPTVEGEHGAAIREEFDTHTARLVGELAAMLLAIIFWLSHTFSSAYTASPPPCRWQPRR